MRFNNKQLILFIIGIGGGIVLASIFKSELLSGIELLGENALLQARYAVIDNSSLFLRLLWQRLGAAILFILLSTTFLGLAAVWFYTCRCGFSLGLLLVMLFSEHGIRGICLLVAGLFPQALVYVPAWIYLFALGERTCRRLFYMNGIEGLGGLKRMGMRLSAQAGLLLFVLAVGCWLEAYVNPLLLRLVLKLF